MRIALLLACPTSTSYLQSILLLASALPTFLYQLSYSSAVLILLLLISYSILLLILPVDGLSFLYILTFTLFPSSTTPKLANTDHTIFIFQPTKKPLFQSGVSWPTTSFNSLPTMREMKL